MLKVLTITDEFTKTALAIEVERLITGDPLVRILDRPVAAHRSPRLIRLEKARTKPAQRSPTSVAAASPGQYLSNQAHPDRHLIQFQTHHLFEFSIPHSVMTNKKRICDMKKATKRHTHDFALVAEEGAVSFRNLQT